MTAPAPGLAGLVLAGGRSTRFGSDKAAFELGGRPLAAIAHATLARMCAEVAVSAPPASAGERIGRKLGAVVLHDDPTHPTGPLAGIVQGLAWADRGGWDRLAVLPCDTPLVTAAVLRRLDDALDPDAGAAVARTANGLQALCCVIRTRLQAPIRQALAAGRHPSIRDALAPLQLRLVDFDDAALFANINAPQDLGASGEAGLAIAQLLAESSRNQRQ